MNKGFTLIEVLIVVVILALVALGIMALLPAGYKQVTNAGRMSVVNHLGYKKLDQLKALGYTATDLTAGLHPSNILDYRQDTGATLDSDLVGYSIYWNVQDGKPISNVKTVTVTVGYMLHDTTGLKISNVNQIEQSFVTYIAQ